MMEIILKAVWVAAFVLAATVRASAGRRLRKEIQRTGTAAKHREALEWPLMALQFLGLAALPVIYVFTSWLGFADYALPDWAGLIGVAIFAGANWLLWRSHVDLGRNWSPAVEVREGQTLVTGGVFRYIRHPMYAAHWLWAVAQVLLLQNWIAGPAFLVALTPLYLSRVPREEQMMLDRFGDEYRAYMQHTGRVIPRI